MSANFGKRDLLDALSKLDNMINNDFSQKDSISIKSGFTQESVKLKI